MQSIVLGVICRQTDDIAYSIIDRNSDYKRWRHIENLNMAILPSTAMKKASSA